MQLSLVSHYGEKPDQLVRLIRQLQDFLSGHLGAAFQPYEMTQVHGTILGMEALVKSDGIYSKWFLENKGISLPIDFADLIPFLQKDLPEIRIKVGGYQSEKDYGFTSRDQHPFLRSFSIQGSIAVAMGWPVREDPAGLVYSPALYELRRSFEAFHLCHKWNQGTFQDNDFFFVLGKIDREKVANRLLEQASREIRILLAAAEILIALNRDSLSIVVYQDTELPPASTRAFKLSGPAFFEKMFWEWYQ